MAKNYLIMNEANIINGLSINEVDGKTVINAPAKAHYLNEFMSALPVGILNKKVTGCGATSVVLENQENVIVCCPTIQLIISKISQYPSERCPYHLQKVMKGVKANEIEEYIKTCKELKQPVKIMTTYDSFPRVAAIVGEDMSGYKIVVDEYHEILGIAIYRNQAAKELLSWTKGMSNVTFLSATPIDAEYTPIELKELPYYEIEWPERQKVKPLMIQSNSPFSSVVNIIRNHKAGRPIELDGKQVTEYFFFVNSVNAIKRIIKSARLTPDEVKVICAKNDINSKLKLQGIIPICDASGPNKTFNFCTKTVFYGADFYSEAGLIVIVSDSWVKSTILDVSTDIIQISGRIRNQENPFRNTIVHIYSLNHESSRIEFEEGLNDRIAKVQEVIKACEALPPHYRKVLAEKIKSDDPEELAYYNEAENKAELDELKIAHMKHKFACVESTYTNAISLEDAYIKAGYDQDKIEFMVEQVKNMIAPGGGVSDFQQFYLIYSAERKKSSIGRSDLAKDIEQQYSIVKLAYDHLGDIEVERLKYDEATIRKMVYYRLPATKAAVQSGMRQAFEVGRKYSLQDIKLYFKQLFQQLRIEIAPKASLIKEYYRVKSDKVRDKENPFRRKDAYRLTEKLFFIFGIRRRTV